MSNFRFLFVLTEKSSRHGDSIMRVNELVVHEIRISFHEQLMKLSIFSQMRQDFSLDPREKKNSHACMYSI